MNHQIRPSPMRTTSQSARTAARDRHRLAWNVLHDVRQLIDGRRGARSAFESCIPRLDFDIEYPPGTEWRRTAQRSVGRRAGRCAGGVTSLVRPLRRRLRTGVQDGDEFIDRGRRRRQIRIPVTNERRLFSERRSMPCGRRLSDVARQWGPARHQCAQRRTLRTSGDRAGTPRCSTGQRWRRVIELNARQRQRQRPSRPRPGFDLQHREVPRLHPSSRCR